MTISPEQKEDGTILRLIFHADRDQDQDSLKAEVKVWLSAHYPAITWEIFFDRVASIDSQRIIVNML